MNKLVFGVGKNDSDYFVQPQINGKQICCPYYRVWHDMLGRCYDTNRLKRKPTYRGCHACEEWLVFSNFKSWMEQQEWREKQLDKDILGDGKIYSPETCCFVEVWLNNLFSGRGHSTGKWPVGVSYYRRAKKFVARLYTNKQSKYLGAFDTPEKAHAIYLKAKREYVTAKMKDYPDEQIKRAVLLKVQNARPS